MNLGGTSHPQGTAPRHIRKRRSDRPRLLTARAATCIRTRLLVQGVQVAINFTDRELDVMAVLWERGSGTVAEVRERLPDELAYTTVLTILRILQEKGYVRHEGEGRAHRFYPLV